MNKVATFKEYIASITIDDAGEFYFGSPGLIIPPPDRGHGNLVQATGTVSIDGFGRIDSVTITNEGDGYTTAPTPYIVGFPTTYGITSGEASYGFGFHDSIATTTDSTDGEGMSVNVTIDSFGTVSLVTAGRGNSLYRVGDTITIDPRLIGGNPEDDPITAQVSKVNGGDVVTLSATVNKVSSGDTYVQPKISPFVGNQLPEVFQVDFPLFKTFFEKYYTFLEQTNTTDNTKHGPLKVLQDFLSKLDVDFNDDGSPITDDNFLVEFFKDYAKDLPLKQSAKLSRVIKDINSFYTAKGSPEAIKYLFKVLYSEDVGVVNSGQFILRPSSNQFTQDYVIKAFESELNPNNVLDLEGRRIDLHYSVSEGASTQNLIKTTTVKRATKISYTNPQTFELVLDLPPSFTLVGPGVGQDGYDDQLFAYVCGNIGTITGTGTGGTFENPSSSVVDGTYTITSSDYTSYLDVEYQNNVEYPKGTYVKANGRIYVTVNEGTTAASGSGPTHELGEALDGTSKFRFLSFDDHKTTSSSGAEFEVVIQGNSIDSVTVNAVGSNYTLNEIFEVPTTVFGGSENADAEYSNGSLITVNGDGSDFFKREVTTNGVRIMGAGTVGGQTAVPDAWLEKVARMVELFTDVNGAGINETSQRNLIKTLSGDAGTYHAGFPTIQRVARGSGAEYTPNFLTDQGIIDWNLTNLYDTTVQNDMVWYLNSSGVGYGDGDTDAQEVIEHVFHTLHMHGLDAQSLKMYQQISADWNTGPLYNAMVEAYDGGFWDSSGYGGANFKTDPEAFEVAAKEYLYLLNFCMFDYSDLWDGDSLAPEWSDTVKTPAGIQANLPLGYALYNSYIAPVISKPSLATIRSIFQDGNTPAQDNPALAGASGYVVDVAATPPVKFKVATITSGKIDHVLITDGGTGFSANPAVTITPDESDTILSAAAISTRVTDGVITSTAFIANARGIGYNNPPSLKVNVANIFTFLTLEGESVAKAFPVRALNGATFKTISPSSSTTDGGFNIGDTFKVSETGSTLGQYAIDYFLEDYAITGVTNNGYVKVTALSDNGYPSEFEVVAVGAGYYRADFTFDITSDIDETCTINVTTGYNALLAGVFKDAGSFLSDANKVFDNRIYQHFSYEIESERPQSEWDGYVRRAAHPIGFGVFGNLQIKQDIDMSSNFVVETDVYMFFKYPDIEEILLSDDTLRKDVHKPDIADSVFPGDGLADRQNIGVVVNKFDVTMAKTDNVALSDEFGPYTLQGTEVQNVYATSDGSLAGDPYFFVHTDEDDDYIERFANGDYFLEDYVEQGNPFKDIEMVFDSTNTGGYATDYFLEDYVLLLNADPQRGTLLTYVNDTITSMNVEMSVVGGDSVGVDDGTILLSFVYFRNSGSDFDEEALLIDDTAVPVLNRVLSESVAIEDDAVELFKGKLQENRVVLFQDLILDEVGKVLADTFNADDSTQFDVTIAAADTMNMQDSPSVEAQPVTTDTFVMADAVDKFDIGVGLSDTPSVNDSTVFETGSIASDDFNANESTELGITTETADTFGAADSGNLISQSFTVDLTYFAEDYVADTVINF